MKFADLGLHATILESLTSAQFLDATPVQEQTYTQTVVNGHDVTVQSQTGTGKTGAFLIPFFQLRLTTERFAGAKAIVLAPTRELAVQIAEEAKLLSTALGLKIGCVYGGVGYAEQESMLKGGVDLLVGTPGRLLDFVGSKKINPKDFAFVVIDEADRLLDMGFYPDMRKLFKMLRPREERLTLLLSATISSRVSQLTWEYMNHPAEIVIEAENVTLDAIEQRLYHVARDEKMSFLLGVLKTQNPETAIVFCNTKRAAEEVAKRLELNGRPAAFIMGDLPQNKRLKIIEDLKAKRVGVLVATDVAARGLHVDALDLVINFDLPEDAENYVHRIGRTARAGAKGVAVSLACDRYVYHLEAIEKYLGAKIPVKPVTDELIVEDSSRGVRIRLANWEEDERGRRDSRPGQGRGPARGGPRDRSDDRPRPTGRSDDRPRSGNRPGLPRGANPETNRGPRPLPNSPRPAPAQRPAVEGGIEGRLAYYRKKYGEDFVPSPELMERLKREEAQRSGASAARPQQQPRQQSNPHPNRRPNAPGRGQAPNSKSGSPPRAPRQGSAAASTVPTGPGPVAQKQSGGLGAWLKRVFGGNKN